MLRPLIILASICVVHGALPHLALTQQRAQREPVIDVHLHALAFETLRSMGPNEVTHTTPPASVEEYVQRTLGEMKKLSPSDPSFEPYWDLAEKLDIPVSIHTGLSFPGITQMGFPNFRVALGSPIHFEGMLNRHPKLRVNMMHAGYPFLAETIGILHLYPQVYADIGVMAWAMPREEFYAYLKALIRAGFEDRIMFGSDQMAWPETIGLAINAIESADFLTQQQKRDILYNNAARFLKLSAAQIARHHEQ